MITVNQVLCCTLHVGGLKVGWMTADDANILGYLGNFFMDQVGHTHKVNYLLDFY